MVMDCQLTLQPHLFDSKAWMTDGHVQASKHVIWPSPRQPPLHGVNEADKLLFIPRFCRMLGKR